MYLHIKCIVLLYVLDLVPKRKQEHDGLYLLGISAWFFDKIALLALCLQLYLIAENECRRLLPHWVARRADGHVFVCKSGRLHVKKTSRIFERIDAFRMA